MKIVFVAMFFAASAFAQHASPVAPAACGPKKSTFDVTLDNTQHTPAQPKPGKALVYFVQDIGGMHSPLGVGSWVTKIGLDGAWVGASENNSYLPVSVEPGEHHICVSAQTRGPAIELAHFNAEAGKVYYFRTRNFMWQTDRLEFDPADSDQALYMIASYPLSVSHLKK